MTLLVRKELSGSQRYRLLIYHNGQYVGEYERSQEEDVERKTEEIMAAESVLLEVFEKHGEFCVRWNGKEKKKSVRVDDIEVAVIPKSCWRRPSWVNKSELVAQLAVVSKQRKEELLTGMRNRREMVAELKCDMQALKADVFDSMSAVNDICMNAVKCRRCFKELDLVAADFDIAQPRWIGPAYWGATKKVVVVLLNPGSGDFRKDGGALAIKKIVANYSKGKTSLSDVFAAQRLDMEHWGVGRRFLNYFENSLGLNIEEIGFLNLAWCATKTNRYPMAMLRNCFHSYGVGMLKGLNPHFVILCGSVVQGFAKEITAVAPSCRIINALHYAHRKGADKERQESARVISSLN